MSLDLRASTGPGSLDDRLTAVAAMVQDAATATAQLWRDDGLDGDLTARLIEVSHALHRAALALGDVDFIGGENPGRQVLWTDPPSAGGADGPQDSSTAQRFAGLLDAVEDYAIFMIGPVGTVTTWNAGAQRIKGYTAEEIIGQHFSVFYLPDDISADKPQRALADAIEQGHSRDDGWRLRKDGTRFWAHVVITPLYDSDGNLEGFAKITRDDTDRNNAELQARQLELLSDRERIAHELQATIVRRIFAAGLAMQGALKLIHDPVVAQRLDDATELLDQTLHDIRTVVLALNTDASE